VDTYIPVGFSALGLPMALPWGRALCDAFDRRSR